MRILFRVILTEMFRQQFAVLICRVQLPEDTALDQAAAAPAQNPPVPVTTPDTANTGSRTTSQNTPAAAPDPRPPTVGGGTGATGPQRPGFIMYLVDHVWGDPHLRICKSVDLAYL